MFTRITASAAIVLILICNVTSTATAQAVEVTRVISSPKFKAAQAFIDKDHDRFVQEIIQLTEIPAPPFKEQMRGRAFLEMLRQHGLTNVEMDAEGNVMGTRRTELKIPNLPRIDQNDSLFRPAAMDGLPKGIRYFPSLSMRADAVTFAELNSGMRDFRLGTRKS